MSPARRAKPADEQTAAIARAVARWRPKLKVTADGCWLWPGTIDRRTGTGTMRVVIAGKGRTFKAARAFWEAKHGPLDTDQPLRSVCGHPDCVRPTLAHRKPVTRAELTLSGNSPMGRNARKTECVNGHPMSGKGSDVYVNNTGARMCRHCWRKPYRKVYGAQAERAQGGGDQ